jgi:CheY-like chemotaxis protein
MDDLRSSRFALWTAGYDFIRRVLPWREPDSRFALDHFLQQAAASVLPAVELDIVFLRCLTVLNRHTGGQLPSLTDRYLFPGDETPLLEDRRTRLVRFRRCVDDILRYRGIGNSSVRGAIAIIEARYGQPDLTHESVTLELRITPSALSTAFKEQTGLTFGEYLRGFRLDEAATLLRSTGKSIKETWGAVGYNYASNFDHDFKRRFAMTPREYRARVIPSLGQESRTAPVTDVHPQKETGCCGRVLLIDDDESTRTTIGSWLRAEGYDVVVASSGAEGLKAATRFSPEAILVDYHLPDMDGVDVLRSLRQQNNRRPPGVALYTADPYIYDRDEELRALEAVIQFKVCDVFEVQRTTAYLVTGSLGSR